MHLLTKGPECASMTAAEGDTPSSPDELTPFELSRYLDHCSELLSLVSKIAALRAALRGRSGAERRERPRVATSGLSRKIWQKTVPPT